MRCRYCYEGEKLQVEITREVIDQTIQFMKNVFDQQRDKKISVMTHGGEPLLAFDKIVYFISKVREAYPNIHIGMTTNATLLDPDKIEFIAQNYHSVAVSIDGTKAAHDANRIYADGTGSYDIVVKNLKSLLEKCPNIQARMTLNPYNYKNLYDGIIELINMGFKDIMPLLDMFSKEWSEDMFLHIQHEMERVILYLRDLDDGENISVGLINVVKCKMKNTLCDGGVTTFTINTNGDIYPCILANGKEDYLLGNVFNGISEDKLKYIHRTDHQVISACQGCTRYDYCTNTRCKIVNEIIEGNANTPISARCEIENIMVRLYEFAESI